MPKRIRQANSPIDGEIIFALINIDVFSSLLACFVLNFHIISKIKAAQLGYAGSLLSTGELSIRVIMPAIATPLLCQDQKQN
jgi:hypothetical protein